MNGRRLGLGRTDPVAAFELAAVGEDSPPMIEFRGHDGQCLALPYARLRSIALHPVRGVSLDFPEHHITVCGRNLQGLYEALLRHRVTFVQEGDLDTVSEDDPFIDHITIGPTAPEVV